MFQAKLTLTNGDNSQTLTLSTDALADLIFRLPDQEETQAILGLLALHPSAQVRANVARMDNLPVDAIRLLAKDTSHIVLNSLMGSSAARDNLTSEELLSICRTDPELAGNIANNIEAYNGLEDDQVLEYVEHHPDPSVRQQLIENYSTPKRVLQRMAKQDPDETLREKAKSALKNR